MINVVLGWLVLITLPLLAFLPDEDGRPGQDTGHEPPGGLQDQEEKKDP